MHDYPGIYATFAIAAAENFPIGIMQVCFETCESISLKFFDSKVVYAVRKPESLDSLQMISIVSSWASLGMGSGKVTYSYSSNHASMHYHLSPAMCSLSANVLVRHHCFCNQAVLLKDYLPYLSKQRRKVKDLEALVNKDGTELRSIPLASADTGNPSQVLAKTASMHAYRCNYVL